MRDEGPRAPDETLLERLTPILVHIQAHLGEDLSLDHLAAVAGLSPSRFHRVFRQAVGETAKQYTSRLRLESAALRLLLHRGNILEIALDSGFSSHEAFTRAFKSRFGITPRAYRNDRRTRRAEPSTERDRLVPQEHCYALSETRVRRLDDLHLAFIRHLGPYEEVDDGLWQELTLWDEARENQGPPIFLGIGHDAPGITDPAKLRFDAAIRVDEPFTGSGRIGYQTLPGGTFAVTTHAGHFETLPQAYQEIFPRLLALRDYSVIALPAVEIYRTTQVNKDFDLNHTEIYLPVRKGKV